MCAVAAETMADVWGWSRAMQVTYSGLGGLAGLCLGLAVGLLYVKSGGMGPQLHRSLRSNSQSLRLVYEPILDSRTLRFTGAETLIRWVDEDGGVVAPDVFVKIAEDEGFIGELTGFVVKRATSELRDLLHQNRELTLNINIAASDMRGNSLFELLEEHVVQKGILPSQIILELTERSTADLKVAQSAIQRLRKDGYRVHIDDFGTGYSSLAYLNQLAANAIKIDRSFTRTIGTGAVTASIVPQMLAMADALGLDVIVEGVETEEQRGLPRRNGKVAQAARMVFQQADECGSARDFSGGERQAAGRDRQRAASSIARSATNSKQGTDQISALA